MLELYSINLFIVHYFNNYIQMEGIYKRLFIRFALYIRSGNCGKSSLNFCIKLGTVYEMVAAAA